MYWVVCQTVDMSNSLFFFDTHHGLRVFCYWLVTRDWFEHLVLIAVMVMSLAFALSDPSLPESMRAWLDSVQVRRRVCFWRNPTPVSCFFLAERKSRSRETALSETVAMILRLLLPHKRFLPLILVFATVAHSAPSPGRWSGGVADVSKSFPRACPLSDSPFFP